MAEIRSACGHIEAIEKGGVSFATVSEVARQAETARNAFSRPAIA